MEAIERHLRDEPEKISRTSIKRLRGHQEAVFRPLKLSRRDVVIVTNRGKPVAVIEGLKGEEDLEDYLLERSPRFWAMIRRARRGKSVDLAHVRKELGLGTRRR